MSLAGITVYRLSAGSSPCWSALGWPVPLRHGNKWKPHQACGQVTRYYNHSADTIHVLRFSTQKGDLFIDLIICLVLCWFHFLNFLFCRDSIFSQIMTFENFCRKFMYCSFVSLLRFCVTLSDDFVFAQHLPMTSFLRNISWWLSAQQVLLSAGRFYIVLCNYFCDQRYQCYSSWNFWS